MLPGNVFYIQIISFEKLLAALKRNGFNPILDKDSHYISKESFINKSELCRVLVTNDDKDGVLEENGLFHQIAKEKSLTLTFDKKKPNQIEELIYLDFALSTSYAKITKYAKELEALFKVGFSVKDKNKVIYHYMPFDKSASMGRQSRISFLSEIGYDSHNSLIQDFYKKIAQRAHLGMNDEYLEDVALAKRYAYRGLLLSGGKRITTEDLRVTIPDFTWSKETVLIVQDMDGLATNVSYFTQTKGKKVESNSTHNYCQFELEFKENENKDETLNDGFGFIDESLSNAIDKKLGDKRNRHNSYQIRLPYVKGMVHKIDFYGFVKDEIIKGELTKKVLIKTYNEKLEKVDKEYSLEELKKVKMIISESMFKCIKELKAYVKNHEEIGDAITYYFNEVNKYDHSLFILDTDKSNERIEDDTTLNYQFLSTIDLTDEEFDSLNKLSRNDYLSLKENLEVQRTYFTRNRINDEDDETLDDLNGFDADETKTVKHNDVEMKLLRLEEESLVKEGKTQDEIKNIIISKDGLINQPRYRNLLQGNFQSMKKNVGTGKLKINGEGRFLAGDVLNYCYYIFSSQIPENEMMPENSFMAPGFKGKNGKSYAVLRNPHLSRNEDLTLGFFVPSSDSIRNKYNFNHLTGVCFIDSTDSKLPAETIGGADFDGDHVKIINNDIYTKAIQKYNGTKDNYPLVINGLYKDNFALTDEDFVDNAYNKYKVNIQTFDNYVGLISNYALQEALRAYSSHTLEDSVAIENHKNKVRLYGILTGVEVDSSKTGIKPDISKMMNKDTIKDGEIKKKDASKYFIDFKSNLVLSYPSVDEMRNKYTPKNSEINKENYYDAIFKNPRLGDFESCFKENVGREPNNVEKLMVEYNILKSYKASNSRKTSLKEVLNVKVDEDVSFKSKVESIIKVYTQLNASRIKQMHVSSSLSPYYKTLVFKSNLIENGDEVLSSVIDKLSSNDLIDNNKFYRIKQALSEENLLLYYYPYFSNIHYDIKKNKALRIQKLDELIKKHNLNFEVEEKELIVSTPELLSLLLKEAAFRRQRQGIQELEIEKDDLYDAINKTNVKSDLIPIFLNQVAQSTNELIEEIIRQKKLVNKNLDEEKEVKGLYEFIKNLYNLEYAHLISEFEDLVRLKVDKLEVRDKPALTSLINNKSIRSIYRSIFEIDLEDSELVATLNKYRRESCKPYQSKLYYSLKKEMTECVGNKKDFIKDKIKNELYNQMKYKLGSVDNLTDRLINNRLVEYIIELEDQCDKKQTFLFDVYGNELIDYYEEIKGLK